MFEKCHVECHATALDHHNNCHTVEMFWEELYMWLVPSLERRDEVQCVVWWQCDRNGVVLGAATTYHKRLGHNSYRDSSIKQFQWFYVDVMIFWQRVGEMVMSFGMYGRDGLLPVGVQTSGRHRETDIMVCRLCVIGLYGINLRYFQCRYLSWRLMLWLWLKLCSHIQKYDKDFSFQRNIRVQIVRICLIQDFLYYIHIAILPSTKSNKILNI